MSGFDPHPKSLGATPTMLAGANIDAGQVVALEAGKTSTVVPASTTTKSIVGVALYGANAGKPLAVAGPGSIVKVRVANGKGVEAGELVFAIGADATVGQVGKLDTKSSGGFAVGAALEKIAATSVAEEGYVLVSPMYVGKEVST